MVYSLDEEIKTLTLGERIRLARITIRMSQKEMADKLFVTQSYISDLENNVYEPKWQLMVQLVKLTRKSFEFFA
jgi:transcriptional regulator with XRE-family HTH domain